MRQELTVEGARRIAALAKTARRARDAMLDNVPEEDLGEPRPARGEHNPTGALGFDPLPLGDLAIAALRQAVSALGRTARSELFVLMGWVRAILQLAIGIAASRKPSGSAMKRSPPKSSRIPICTTTLQRAFTKPNSPRDGRSNGRCSELVKPRRYF
jgi:hypothetical protein